MVSSQTAREDFNHRISINSAVPLSFSTRRTFIFGSISQKLIKLCIMQIADDAKCALFEIMKVFRLIFIVYLLVLSVQPCRDLGDSRFSYSKAENGQTMLNGDAPQQETPECSPFCICSCRQVSVTDNFSALSLPKEIAVLTATASLVTSRNDYSRQYPDSIWQPPKFNFTT